MPDYKQGKIYCLRSHQTDDIYIGSTVQPLYKRLHSHKKCYKKWKEGKYGCVTSFEIIKHDDCYIELLEECPCDNKNQLERREGQLIREMDCVNKVVAGRSKKEYYHENKEQISERGKKYYEANKEQISERGKKYREEHKEQIKDYLKENKERIAERWKGYYQKNKKRLAEQKKKYQQENKEELKKYREKNKEQIAERMKKYREAHKDDFKCELCNYAGDKRGYNRHLKSKKHINSKGSDDSNN